jgi:hypothetical protein
MRFQSAHVGPETQKKRLDVNDNSSWKTHFFFSSAGQLTLVKVVLEVEQTR